MSRLVKIQSADPYKLETLNGKVWICQCGLSKNKPYCDGSHTRTLGEELGNTYMYTEFTQSRYDLTQFDRSRIEAYRSRQGETIYKTQTLEVYRLHTKDSQYSRVISIRKEANVNPLDVFDEWSDLYLLKKDGEYCATMRVTQARDGLLDVESYFPDFIHDPKIRCLIGSASKLCKTPKRDCSRNDILTFISEVWKDQYRDGMRVDLINATIRIAAYYERLGYKRVGDSFIHPITKKESVPLVYIAHPDYECVLTQKLKQFYDDCEKPPMGFEELYSKIFYREPIH